MDDRYNYIHDRTLILRILVPGLEACLRDKMEECGAPSVHNNSNENNSNGNNNNKNNTSTGVGMNRNSGSHGGGSSCSGGEILDLEGVRVQPTVEEGYTIWKFHCDGAEYPARLVNLPCPVEVHKTYDHAMYYKCTDVAQMLIVYEDKLALEEDKITGGGISGMGIKDGAEFDITYDGDRSDGGGGGSTRGGGGGGGGGKERTFPSYYPHGLTPPLKRVVERRFMNCEHSTTAPPRSQITQVESDLIELMQKISKEGGGGGGGGGGGRGSSSTSGTNKRNKVPSLAAAQQANKVLEEIDEQIVDYEPWMDDHGREPHGIEFEADDPFCVSHPEVWLDADEIQSLRNEAIKKLEEQQQRKKKQQEEAKLQQRETEEQQQQQQQQQQKSTKKSSKKKKEPSIAAVAVAAVVDDHSSSSPTFGVATTTKKGIASTKNKEENDEVTQAAKSMMSTGNLMDDVLEDDDFGGDFFQDLSDDDILGGI